MNSIRIPFLRKYINETIQTDKRYIDHWGGRGRGGSHFATQYFLFLITSPAYFRGYFVRRTFRDIRGSLFKDFKDRISETDGVNIKDFHINEQDLSIKYLPTGNELLSKGVTGDGKRTAKMKSLAGATHVVIEEADELLEEEFDQLDLSLRTIKTTNIKVLRVFNPPNLRHWIWRDYNLIDSKQPGYYKAVPKSDSNLCSVFADYRHNIKNINETTIDKFESFREKDPQYYWTVIRGLISEGAKGRIFSGWKPITAKEYEALEYNEYYGLDWGFSDDPVALIGVKAKNNKRYIRKYIYEPGLLNSDLIKKMQAMGRTQDSKIIADSSEPKSIMDLRQAFPLTYGAGKGNNSIKYGINLIKECEVYYVEDDDIENEYQEYKWELSANKEPTDSPVDKNNHIMDSFRYIELMRKYL